MSTEEITRDHTAEPIAKGMAPALRIATAATLVFAVVGSVAGGTVGTVAATAAVAVVIAVPLVRVLWLAVRWWRDADGRFALAAFALLVVVLAGAGLAVAFS